MTSLQIMFAAFSPLLTLAGMFIAWMKWRETQLRRNEVLMWADDCIESLQTLVLASTLKEPFLNVDKIHQLRIDTAFRTSILIERGRLFFKNEVSDTFGSEKLPAYRGYRPRILDHLVIAHQIARYWPNENDEEAMRRSVLAENCLKNFVSLVQKEVGRDRAASAEALKGGDGVNLQFLMGEIDKTKLKHWIGE